MLVPYQLWQNYNPYICEITQLLKKNSYTTRINFSFLTTSSLILLDLSHHKIIDTSSFSTFSFLTTSSLILLDLSNYKIIDISSFSTLTKLQSLHLQSNPVAKKKFLYNQNQFVVSNNKYPDFTRPKSQQNNRY